VTTEGGLLLSRDSSDPYLLIGDAQGSAAAVLVKQGGTSLIRARVRDNAERGETKVTVEHLCGGRVLRVLEQRLSYDPFTGR
jgi:hypothetical protein